MARRGWDSLSDNYRKRLTSKGIDRAAYEHGESITAARGHARTPETPRSFRRELFPDYADRRETLTRRLAEKKERLFGTRPPDPRRGPRFNPDRSRDNITEYAPSMKMLEWALQADEDELIDAIREDPEAFAFLGYH